MKFKLEVWVSMTAMITAVAAVVVAIIQTQVMHEEAELERQHSRLSVKPSLLLYSKSHVGDDEGSFSFGIQNQGLGPAIIKSFLLKLNGKVITNWSDFFEQATEEQVFLRGKQRNVSDITENKILSGIIVPAGKGLPLIHLGTSAQIATHLRASDSHAEVSLCYCSFYDECWLTTNNSMEQQLVSSCRVLNAPDFISLDSIN